MAEKKFMKLALLEAEKAVKAGEVPVGAIIVKDGKVLSAAHNRQEELQDATAHAEVLAIRQAAERLGNWRLTGCTLYVTMEPCTMCSGAIFNSRIDRLIFGCRDSKAGGVESLFNILSHPSMKPSPEIIGGFMEEECSALMQEFFRRIREERKKR